ncbi:TIGR03087 family PEP-CTERM/XrtA system glycosyltransferase [Pontixanthobacter aestiaquae]|uniref:TIGR03087 family PEP-CTERM/XrtA system glycosyltransferase n=1 Tax=Pontixanthobacter aestiaquae TaxID=1509367 RepID=A0A844Z727_9SPHN|nr:TIGR03087 family PEP-CTERM/XrtA system glycosyltransferase [Pontixanthobacter aestiaquae]MDN3645283.1 TIGR03087 family PEP-CTERM/XrtA system glycosyltransferase [Pontixanthobacter aestiaquae]MXO83715.1 TIGR03087 family PEP-CTERM/XrtA system glycosyltransferase [Pontixanthobacter aestiaquae]
MGDILFLAHRMPFPPDRGDKIRSHHLLKALARLAPIHVGCFGDTDNDYAHEHLLADIAETYYLPRRSKGMVRAGIEALAKRKPVSLTAFEDAALAEWVAKTIRERDIQTIFVFSGQMGQYIPASFAGQVVVDLCDVDSAKFEAYAADGRFPRKWIDAREGRILSQVEQQLAKRADYTLFVSEAEEALFRSRLERPQDCKTAALRNGIDTAFFDPANSEPHSDLANSTGPNFVFTGQMDYAPNIGAALRVMDRLLPQIRAVHPDATFHLVGRAPVSQLTKRDGEPGIRVWGEVPDVRPFLAGADVVIAPLEIARGVQNKVLEAMAMARPVLLSPEAATGIDASDGEHFAVAPSDQALVGRALEMLDDGPSALLMAAAARRYVVEQQGWDAMLAPLARLCGYAPAAATNETVNRNAA